MKSKASFLECLKTTPIIQVACQKTGISRATYYRWRKEDEKFKTKSDSSLKEGTYLINDMAESQLISLIKEKNMTAIIFWLKHHHKDYSENRMYLSIPDQEKLTNSINAMDIKGIYNFILNKMSKGEISKSTASSLISIINRNYPNGVQSSRQKEITDELKKLAKFIDECRTESPLVNQSPNETN